MVIGTWVQVPALLLSGCRDGGFNAQCLSVFPLDSEHNKCSASKSLTSSLSFSNTVALGLSPHPLPGSPRHREGSQEIQGSDSLVSLAGVFHSLASVYPNSSPRSIRLCRTSVPSPPCLHLHSLSFTLRQLHQPPPCSHITLGTVLPPNLCTCCFLYLESCYSDYNLSGQKKSSLTTPR